MITQARCYEGTDIPIMVGDRVLLTPGEHRDPFNGLFSTITRVTDSYIYHTLDISTEGKKDWHSSSDGLTFISRKQL